MGGPPLGTVSFALVDRCAAWSLVGKIDLVHVSFQRIPSNLVWAIV